MVMMPPSTARIWPVMCLPAGLQKSRAAPLRSSPSPMRRSRAFEMAPVAAAMRLFLYAGLGWAVLVVTGSLTSFFALGAAAMTVYGLLILWSVASGH